MAAGVKNDARVLEALSVWFRAQRDVRLRGFIDRARAERDRPFRILDLGGRAVYWRRLGLDWLRDRRVEVTLANLTGDEMGAIGADGDVLRHVLGDATAMAGHADGAFDMIHSNSVVEHVGRWPEMKRFAAEVRRLAPAYYVQTPYFWFPVDPHFYRLPLYHWMPESVRVSLHRRFRLGHGGRAPDLDAAIGLVASSVLLDRRQFRTLFPDGEHRFERLAGLPKSMIATRVAP